jgi:Calx-beta domain
MRPPAGLLLVGLVLALMPTLRSAEAAQICGAGGIATKTWDGGGDGAHWADAGNWAPDGVPGATDHVCIDSATVSFNSSAPAIASLEASPRLDVTAGTLSITDAAQPSTIATLDLSGGGTVGGAGDLTVGTFNWGTGGVHSAPSNATSTTVTGALNLSGGGLFNSGIPLTELSSRSLVLSPGVDATAQPGGFGNRFYVNGDARLEIGADAEGEATLSLAGGVGVSTVCCSAAVVNDGTLRKSSGTGTSEFGPTLQNNGTVEVLAGTLQPSGDFTNPGGGTVEVRSGTTFDPTGALTNNGTLKGAGTVAANTTSAGTVAPGLSPGTLTIAGNYTQTAAGTLASEIAGAGAGEFDRLVVDGTASLGGTLAIATDPAFTPPNGSSFEIETGARSGQFATVTGADLPNGAHYDVQYAPASVTLATVAGPPQPEISIADGSAPEHHASTTAAELTVSLASPAPAGGVTVDYATADGTATAPSDYTARSGQLSFAEGQASKKVQIGVSPDTTLEDDETFVVNLSNPSGATIADGQGTWTIENDDTPPGTPICGSGGIATRTWDGGGTSDQWFDAENWAPDGLPEVEDYVCIDDVPLVRYGISDQIGGLEVLGVEAPNSIMRIEDLPLRLGDVNHPSSVTILDIGMGATVDGPADLTVEELSLYGGLGGDHRLEAPSAAATTTVTERMLWDDGSLDGSLAPYLHNRTLRLAPGVTATGDADLVMGIRFATQPVATAARIEVQRDAGTGASATLQLDEGARIVFDEGAQTDGRIVNDGTIRKTATTDAQSSLIDPTVTNNGSLVVERGTLRTSGDLTVPAGEGVEVRAGATFDPTGALTNNGTLKGAGTVAANTTSAGTVAPGLSPGTLTIAGNYTQTAAGTLATEIAGKNVGQFDRLVVDGTASLDGTLAIATDPAFTPPNGSSFEIETGARSGQFATVTGADLANGGHYDVQYAPASVTLAVAGGDPTAPDPPELTGTDPASPSNVNDPRVIGNAQAGSTVRVYKSPDCSGDVAASGSAFELVSPGIRVSVPDNSTTTFTATATDAADVTSACSDPITYVHEAPEISIDDVSAPEGNGPTGLHFTVSLSSPAPADVSVDYATVDGTATAPSDYTAESGRLNFAEGQTSKVVAVLVKGDAVVEPDETVFVDLSDPSGATIADNRGVGTVENDDQPAISIDDVIAPEGNSPFVFTISLSQPPAAGGVTVDYATADDNAQAPLDYATRSGQLSFSPNGETSRTVSIPVNNDSMVENDERFFVRLSNATGATTADGEGFGRIRNDDTPREISIDDVGAFEGDSGKKRFRFTVSLSSPAPAHGVTVKYLTDPLGTGTARAPSDYAGEGGTLTFPEGATSRNVDITVKGDTTFEATEQFFVTLYEPSGATFPAPRNVISGRGTIRNDDTTTSGTNQLQNLDQSVDVGLICLHACTVKAAGSLELTRATARTARRAERARYRLRPDSKRLAAGRRATLKLNLPRRAWRAARKTLRRGGRVVATVRVKITERGGRTKRERLRIRLT